MRQKKKSKSACCCWSILALVVAAIVATILLVVLIKTKPDDESGAPGAPVKKYADALTLAMQFFDIQKSGKLEKNQIDWRGDSGLKDGSEAKLDLSKGMYDAGDHMKFGFPMAFTATVLSWAILEYGDQMQVVDQLEPARGSLKWITDYLINAHPSENVLYIQVGDPKLDHSCWNRPEDMTEKRPLRQVNTSAAGTEVAAETAAALASASLVFKAVDSTYATSLLKHAKQLFAFADKYRKSYSISIPEVQSFYNSTGYGDELLWAAGWLYHATGDKTYFEYATGDTAEDYGNWGNPTWFSWDNKLAGAQVLLSRVSYFGSKDVSNNDVLGKYRETAEAVMCGFLPNSPTATESRTENGLIWVSEWNALQQSVSSAFLAVVYSDYMLTSRTAKISCSGTDFKPSDLRDFAISQANYVLGDNPMKMSYVVGYGDNYPQQVHHRGASIPADESPTCKEGFKWLEADTLNPNIATGALVGGPFLNDTYIDARNNSMQGEPSTYNSALLVGLLSGLVTTSSVVQSFA
ncbi:Endoglucanase 10 [Sesamum alatum]|uniref:Endoglucanase n=1 Tax=Sesamum alatum TaxID=300844 RepID=A0AAE2CP70_9LAMI|nr:Endoglucanase 10 [Sesamum alatum]